MKKMNKYLLFIGLIMFACVVNVSAGVKYTRYECNELKDKDYPIRYHLMNHDPDPVCQYNEYITMTEFTKGDTSSYWLLGGDGHKLENPSSFSDHYPNFIVVVGKNDIDWYGADTIEAARNEFRSHWVPEGIFINENYLKQLKNEVKDFDTAVYKTCAYETYGDRSNIKLMFNKDGYYIESKTYLVKTISFSSNFMYTVHSSIKNNECPALQLCHKNIINGSHPEYYYTVYSDSMDEASSEIKCEWDSKTTSNGVSVCYTYETYKNDLEKYYSSGDKTNYNRLKTEISSMCKFVTSNRPYKDLCTQACMKFNDDIVKIEGTNTLSEDNCGFSNKMVIWIMNILRWVKYIIPVLLIVLSILDFIKAMAGEKDDDLKKAQKHFVTRLIVAVLIFIMPLIIEFVLNKMGFSAEDCGIKNIGLGK